MLPLVMPLLTTVWNKVYGWVILVGVLLASLWFLYAKGWRDAQTENTVDVLRRDLENRNEANNVRQVVATEPDPVAKLHQDWSRDGR